MKTMLFNTSLMLAFGVVTLNAQAAVVNSGDTLSITNAVMGTNTNGSPIVVGGSWFAMDLNGNNKIDVPEKSAVNMGTRGIIIGTVQSPGEIDHWTFLDVSGQDWTNSAITGDTIAGLNMSGWIVRWNGQDIPMPSGAWNPTNCATAGISCANASGIGRFTWDGVYDAAYTLDYAATVPTGPFIGTKYYLHMEGAVAPVPVPAAVWLLGSGLLGLIGVARRKNPVSA